MLRLAGDQVESLLDELLPVEVRELPAELAVLDRLLADPRLLAPITQAWERGARGHGRPTIPMACFVRLMVIKQRTGWGYETLVREVSDSLHLRRFCLLPLTARVPDESTVRKLVRRLGSEDGQRADSGGDRQGPAGGPLCGPGGAHRRHRGRGRHPLPDRWGAGLAGRPGAGPRGPQAGRSAAWPDRAGGGSFAADRQAGAGDLQRP